MEMSKGSVNFLGRHWKQGWISRFNLPIRVRLELKRFGIIERPDSIGRYKIDRQAFGKLMSGKQMKLGEEN